IVEKRADGRVETEATIKIWVDGERYVRTAEGNGPVNALDRALREALAEIHPHLRDIDLVNFKVRILDEAKGTGAVTRVLLDASESIPMARPLIGQREEELVLETLRTGRLSLGPLLERFEESFAAAVGARWASAVSSGTAGLHLAVRAVGVSDGDEVITSPFS